MARTTLPQTVLSPTAGVVNPSTTAIDATNGMNLALAAEGVPAGPNSAGVTLVVNNTFAGAKHVIVRAGAANPPAFRKDIGDLSISIAQNQTAYVGPLEWARFAQSDGSLNIDFDAGTTGTILALVAPRSF